jgi:hypothetical protein
MANEFYHLDAQVREKEKQKDVEADPEAQEAIRRR